jgi:hypothetical protein
MLSLKGKSISTFVKHNKVNNQKIFHACSTIFVGFDAFLEKGKFSKTHVEKNKSVCMHTNSYKCLNLVVTSFTCRGVSG